MIVSVRIPTVSQISGQVRIETSNPFKVHINNLKPSVASSVLTTVSIWSPVVASGLKVVASAKLCTPVSAKLEIDLQSRQPSLRLSMEPQQKPVEWVKLETRPMTFTRQYRFPLTAYPAAQYKTIVNEEWNRVQNVREIQIVRKTEQIIEKVFGERIRIEGMWHRTPVNAPTYLPVCPFSGPNHFTIRSEPSEQLPKEWVLKVSGKMSQNAEQKIRSEPFEMEEEQLNIENYESDKAYEATIKTELYTQGSSQERKAEMETRISFSPNLRVLKAQNEIQVSPIPQLTQQKVKLCSSGSIQYPQAPQSFSELRGKSVVAQLKSTWGQGSCQEENKVEIKMAAKHTQKQQQELDQEPEYRAYSNQEECESRPERCSPVELEQAMKRAQELLEYTMEAKYNNVHPALKNATAKLFRSLKALYYWNTNEINFDVQNPRNTIRAQLTIDSRTRQFFNLTVKTPVENVTMTDVKLPVALYYPVSIRRSQSEIESSADLLENAIQGALPECRISSQRLQTFDRVSVRAPLSDCWTLLAKDCDSESEPTHAVLIKKIAQNSEQKAIKILSPEHTIVITPESASYDSLSVKVNGQKVSQEELPRNQHVQIKKDGQQIRVTLPKAGIRVHFDGYSAKVQMSPAMVGRQCGICGHYDGESQDEFRTPQNELVDDVRSFIQANTVKEGNCQFPQQLADIDSSSEELSYQPRWEQNSEEQNADSDEEQKSASASSEEEDREASVSPVQRLVTEEEGGKICISAEKVPRCPRDSVPQEWEEESRKVALKCLPRSHPEAHRFLNIARQQRQIPQEMQEELEKREASYTTEVSVPKRCQRQY
jgi:hypothetical protein